MKVQLHHIGLAVGDIDATIEALSAALGAVRAPAPLAGHTLLRIGDLRLALVARTGNDPRERAWGDHLALTVPAASRHEVVGALLAKGWQAQEVRGRIYVRNDDGSLTLELLAE